MNFYKTINLILIFDKIIWWLIDYLFCLFLSNHYLQRLVESHMMNFVFLLLEKLTNIQEYMNSKKNENF